MKKIKLILTTLVFSTVSVFNTFAGQWIHDGTGWWYRNDDNTYTVNDWQQIDEKWYYFNDNGYMLSNQWIENYYVGIDGALESGVSSQNQGLNDTQKSIMKNNIEVFLYVNDWHLEKYPGVPVVAADIDESHLLSTFWGHLVYDSVNAASGISTLFPVSERDGQITWFDYSKSKQMFNDLYGRVPSEAALNSITDINGNRIRGNVGDPGSWTYITITNYEAAGNTLYVYMDFKNVIYYDTEATTVGKYYAKYTQNSDSFLGYTLESIGFYN